MSMKIHNHCCILHKLLEVRVRGYRYHTVLALLLLLRLFSVNLTANKSLNLSFLSNGEDADPSVHATVIGLAANYNLESHQKFVGSLRYSGFQGQIILGIETAPNDDRIVPYLISQNVTIKNLTYVPCSFANNETIKKNPELRFCIHPYGDIKFRMSRFSLWRDWLDECTICTGPVLVTDFRDVVFQRNPFSSEYGSNVRGLQLFEDPIEIVTVAFWFTEWPIRSCRNVTYKGPMLCSGTVVGTRQAMLHYLNLMEKEVRYWFSKPNCRFDQMAGDDQAVHNYLYYSGQLPEAITIPFRQTGSIVVTISLLAEVMFANYSQATADGLLPHRPYPGSTQDSNSTTTTWFGTEYNLTNKNGFIVDEDLTTVTPVLHQYDRFGSFYESWLQKQPWSGYGKV
jgi:hypothetical protein